MKKHSFTLMEMMIAIAIFGTSVMMILDKMNHAMEKSYYATESLKAQKIVDEIMALYRLNPFSTEPIDLEKDYSPFEVNVSVQEESINILPEEWRIDPAMVIDDEDENKVERIILRVTVKIEFPSLNDTEKKYKYEVSTLIRHIELDDEDDF